MDYGAPPWKAPDGDHRQVWGSVATDRIGGLTIAVGPDLPGVEPDGRSSGRNLR